MDYFDFKNFFNDKYKIKDEIWSMDDNAVVDYSGLEQDAGTLFYAKIDIDIDRNYNVLDPDTFADKIYKAFCDRYGEQTIKDLFISPRPLGGKYPEIAKKTLMVAEGKYGFDLYYTNKRVYSYQKGILCEGFNYDLDKDKLKSLLPDVDIMNVFSYKEDNKIMLICGFHINWLTDINKIAEYIKKPVTEVYKILYANEIAYEALSTEIIDELSSISGLSVTEKIINNRNCIVKFKFANGNTGLFIAESNYYRIEMITENDETKYLNELGHFVKDNWKAMRFNLIDEAIDMLRKYIIKSKGD